MQTQNIGLVIGLMLAKFGVFLNRFLIQSYFEFHFSNNNKFYISLNTSARQKIMNVKGAILGKTAGQFPASIYMCIYMCFLCMYGIQI